MSTFEAVGEGLTVFAQEQPIEGALVFLETPQAVMEFVANGDVEHSIALARGGTTTFLTPALAAGVAGVITLQGTPESHLGIVSREYGIPALMGTTFAKGVRSSRGEVIPPDGARVVLDVSTAPHGRVLVAEGTAYDDTPVVTDAALAAQMEEIGKLLVHYRGEVPHGIDGDRVMRGRMTTRVLELTRESLHRELEPLEADELVQYMGWEAWDFLALRATEGESGLIPRQAYEAIGAVQVAMRYPEYYAWMLDRLGIDGLIGIGAAQRHEIGTKVNLLHMWCAGVPAVIGRGIVAGLGLHGPGEWIEETRAVVQHTRRLYAGGWGDEGFMFTPSRRYSAPLLDETWIERFKAERVTFADEADRQRLQRFSASTEMFGFLQHLDNRCGLADTGPYPLEDGGYLIVRDHFINETLYPWASEAAGDLPYAVTEALFFRDAAEFDLKLMDGSTLFTEPGNYLKNLTGAVVYARDTWDTPVSEVRRLDAAEMESIHERCRDRAHALYATIAGWSEREKILNGAKVYYVDFIAPFLRRAGLWDEFQATFSQDDLDPIVERAWPMLVDERQAETLIPQLLLTGSAFAPMTVDPADIAAQLPALQRLAIVGVATELPGDVDALEAAGWIGRSDAGITLTDAGSARRAELAAAERRQLDLDQLGAAYERFLAANGPLKRLCSQFQVADEDGRFELTGQLADIVERVTPAVTRTSALAPRFAPYADRLNQALAKALDGDHDYVLSPRHESVHTVWMELHEDYLLTQGISREEEGSY